MKNTSNPSVTLEYSLNNNVARKKSELESPIGDVEYDDMYWWLWWVVTGWWFRPFYRTCWILISNLGIVFTYVNCIIFLSPLCMIDGQFGKQLFWRIEESLYGLIFE